MRRKVEFEAVYQQGRRYGDAYLSMTVRLKVNGIARLGLAIAAKTVGNAIARNKLRRIIRESFRLAQHRLPKADFIIGARAAVRHAPSPIIRASLESLWEKAVVLCAASSTL